MCKSWQVKSSAPLYSLILLVLIVQLSKCRMFSFSCINLLTACSSLPCKPLSSLAQCNGGSLSLRFASYVDLISLMFIQHVVQSIGKMIKQDRMNCILWDDRQYCVDCHMTMYQWTIKALPFCIRFVLLMTQHTFHTQSLCTGNMQFCIWVCILTPIFLFK